MLKYDFWFGDTFYILLETHCNYALLVLGAKKEDTFSIGVKTLTLSVGIDVVSCGWTWCLKTKGEDGLASQN